ncbi:MAG: biopolymer transporter ExbD [Planctomycetota bacterium]
MSMGKSKQSPEDVSINLTPMIDVVFLLVIFFMVGSKFSESESRINVSVPAVGSVAAAARTPDDRVVEVVDEGQVLLDGEVVSPEQLIEILQAQVTSYPELNVLVRANSDRSLKIFAETIHNVRSSGVQKIGIAVKSDDANRRLR